MRVARIIFARAVARTVACAFLLLLTTLLALRVAQMPRLTPLFAQAAATTDDAPAPLARVRGMAAHGVGSNYAYRSWARDKAAMVYW